MNLVIVSGLSGSGKTIALHTLEDMGYYCIDNLPLALLEAVTLEFSKPYLQDITDIAIGIDARNQPDQINRFPGLIEDCRKRGTSSRIIFLQAENQALIKRYSETRRKHPLTGPDLALADAIERERSLLAPVSASADRFIDTSRTNIYQLRTLVRETIGTQEIPGLSIVLQSFGYKHGIPPDADFVFDVRCLPNPYWEPGLRHMTGLDREVIGFLDGEPAALKLCDHIENFMATWVPCFRSESRSYLSIAIGCTGGQHRSVYLVERLASKLGSRFGDIVIRHRELA
ncbi:MAG: RNase adapter RapZ [Pseudomonadota bacterium]|nr:RNase adapter RapZ [Pseudomonadota bacterium]